MSYKEFLDIKARGLEQPAILQDSLKYKMEYIQTEVKTMFVFNWKTTLLGVASVLTGVVSIIKGDMSAGISAIVAGIGLIFAKDGDKTGTGS